MTVMGQPTAFCLHLRPADKREFMPGTKSALNPMTREVSGARGKLLVFY